MRVVKFTLNNRLSSEMNYSVETEVVIGDDGEASQAGFDAITFINDFQNGVIQAATELSP